MKVDQGLPSFREELFASPLPSTRRGSASINLDMSELSDDSEEFCDFASTDGFTDEGRLSRSLQSWMIHHEWSTIQPLEKPPREPVFSGKLGKDGKRPSNGKRVQIKCNNSAYNHSVNGYTRTKTAPMRRTSSNDSIHTSLSLLTCSTVETEKPVEEDVVRYKKRRKRRVASRASSSTEESQFKSIWVDFASRKTGNLNRLLRTHAALTDYGNVIVSGDDGLYSEESEAFRMLENDVQRSLFQTGQTRGIAYVNKSTLKRSASLSNLIDGTIKSKPKTKRALSASSKQPKGKLTDLAELKRERMKQLMAIEETRILAERERQRRNSRRLTKRKSSRNLMEHQHKEHREARESLNTASPTNTNTTAFSVKSNQSSDVFRPFSPSDKSSLADTEIEEKQVSVWAGDREILEIDLRRGLSQRVKHRISTTRKALKRVTGMGEGNEQRLVIGKHDEFPKHVEEDYCHKPRIVQKMRISPHLSGMIHNDIQVRMGRPRYHEIKIDDLRIWDRGQSLNRAHRNLKVFNWLHSLKEYDYRGCVEPDIDYSMKYDVPYDLEMLHVESADEPDVKPLYRQYQVRIL